MKFKKVITCLCAFALVATMFPTSAFATINYWSCPKCAHDQKYDAEIEGDTVQCDSCKKWFDQCPDCNDWLWWDNADWERGVCPSCAYTRWHQDVRANLKNQTYAYGQSNRIIIDVTYDVNWIEIYRINPNGKHVEVACFDPDDVMLYEDYNGWNRNYDYTIEYWDYSRQRDTKYKYYVNYGCVTSTGISCDSGTTATKTYWTTPKLNPNKVATNNKKVSWSKVSGADGYCVSLNRYKNIGPNEWWRITRKQWTTKTNVSRKLDPHPNYKYERVNSVRSYAKHGDKYYAHGQKVRTVKTNLFK